MTFAYDTERSLLDMARLVNTAEQEVDQLGTPAELDGFLDVIEFTRSRAHTEAELAAVRELRPRLRAVWTAGEDEAVQIVNAILREARALPQLVKHDHWDYHLHATTPDAPVDVRLAVEAAMALVDVIREKELDRLQLCAAEGCHAVLVDLSRNRSKRFCDTGNCANRTHVAAYRARKHATAGSA
ncbi:CGNR zinc finger domain-containing protein [Arthrobacter mobilis]|uniref:CGNR zinc finger domain-containing protein n=1 Tax=Arthrobacter mobilis TaxID=2724944 RepID=A0A7X6HFX3_9MICC|nr:CGNR zinc finger domain-containing protein [Arthrobacter mobilis]NKX55650.1 CGNR zinc finger domain-containing protein [Arthrobacter mobilis]